MVVGVVLVGVVVDGGKLLKNVKKPYALKER